MDVDDSKQTDMLNIIRDNDNSYDASTLRKNLNEPCTTYVRRLSADITINEEINSDRSSISKNHYNSSDQNMGNEEKLENEKMVKECKNDISDMNKALDTLGLIGKAGNIHEKSEGCIDAINDIDALDESSICGFGCFKPKWLQKWATPRMYLILFSILQVTASTYYNYFVGMISTFEKRYAFKTKVSTSINLPEEIFPLFLGIIIGYFGNKTHRPRLVASGTLLCAFCCLFTAFPYFIYGSAKNLSLKGFKNETGVQACNSGLASCDLDERPPTVTVIVILLFANFLKGFSNITLNIIGLPYMDDNAKKKNTPIYFAILFATRLIGPLLGYLLSSVCLKYYENPYGMVSSIKRLLKNPVLIFMTISTVMKIWGHFGHAIMLPKYIENQFKLSASDANLYSGATSIACIMVSTILGGILIWKYRPSTKVIVVGMIASEITLSLGFLVLMVPRCQTMDLLNFGKNDEGLILNGACNENCGCTTNAYTPYCGPDGKTAYFSPCHAGCTEEFPSIMYDKEHKVYGNCSCVTDDLRDINGKITEGYCVDENCWTQAKLYISIFLVLTSVSTILAVAHTMILLRSVHPNDKSVALGIFESTLCLFGFVSFPPSFGALVDSACLVWEKSCDQTGNCWFYDMEKYNYMLHSVSSCFCMLSAFSLMGLYKFRDTVRNLYEDEDEDEKDFTDIKLDTVSGSQTKL